MGGARSGWGRGGRGREGRGAWAEQAQGRTGGGGGRKDSGLWTERQHMESCRGSVGGGVCHQAWRSEFNPPNPHRWKEGPESTKLSSDLLCAPTRTISKGVLRESIQQEQIELWKGGERAAHRFFFSLPHCPSKTTFLKSFHNQQGFGVFILFPSNSQKFTYFCPPRAAMMPPCPPQWTILITVLALCLWRIIKKHRNKCIWVKTSAMLNTTSPHTQRWSELSSLCWQQSN